MKETVLSFEKVAKAYKKPGFLKSEKINALNGVSFSVEKGEVVGLLGLNGAGKTTIIKLIAGLLKPDSGEIKIFGKSPSANSVKSKIGYLPELPYFYSYLSALDAVMFYAGLSGLEGDLKEKALAALEKVGMKNNVLKKAGSFSKGMLQRLGFAQAFIHQPEFMILDEPVSGLDPIAIKDIRNLVMELNAAGKTFFMSSHSISELEKICNRVLIISQGSIHSAVSRQEWETVSGGLENIFVKAVSSL